MITDMPAVSLVEGLNQLIPVNGTETINVDGSGGIISSLNQLIPVNGTETSD